MPGTAGQRGQGGGPGRIWRGPTGSGLSVLPAVWWGGRHAGDLAGETLRAGSDHVWGADLPGRVGKQHPEYGCECAEPASSLPKGPGHCHHADLFPHREARVKVLAHFLGAPSWQVAGGGCCKRPTCPPGPSPPRTFLPFHFLAPHSLARCLVPPDPPYPVVAFVPAAIPSPCPPLDSWWWFGVVAAIWLPVDCWLPRPPLPPNIDPEKRSDSLLSPPPPRRVSIRGCWLNK